MVEGSKEHCSWGLLREIRRTSVVLDPEMAQHVSGSDRALLVCIRDGEIPRPPLVDWNNWQIWRRDIGRRPVSATDGYATSSTLENTLWKGIMAEY